MRGHGYRSIVQENLLAHDGLQTAKRFESTKKRMCWKCQQEKQTKGGHMKMFTGGPMKFICKECMDAKAQTKGDENV